MFIKYRKFVNLRRPEVPQAARSDQQEQAENQQDASADSRGVQPHPGRIASYPASSFPQPFHRMRVHSEL